MVFNLDSEDGIWFPSPVYGDFDGCIAFGGDLSVERLTLAYNHGIFPWYPFEEGNPIMWYCPLERFVIFPDEIHVSHSMRTLMNKQKYKVTWNTAFEGVIHNCSALRYDQDGAWLGEDMIEAYTRLHELGLAASVEVWDGGRLVGGLYGVTINKNAFVGESMFSLVPSASKLALIFLARKMKADGVSLIDCQLETAHLKSMGGRYISYQSYMDILNKQ